MRTPKSLILPNIENIKDEEMKKMFEKYNGILSELVIYLNTDISELLKRIEDLEP